MIVSFAEFMRQREKRTDEAQTTADQWLKDRLQKLRTAPAAPAKPVPAPTPAVPPPVAPEDESPAAQFARMRAQTQGLGDGPKVGNYKPNPQAQTSYSISGSGFLSQVADAARSGFAYGGAVSPNLVQQLGLTNQNYSLVADSLLNARGHAYPFYKEKKAGQPTGRIMYVQGYPVEKLLQLLQNK